MGGSPWLFALVVIGVLSVFISAYLKLRRVAAQPLPSPVVVDSKKDPVPYFDRTAAHEDGHALVAYLSTAVAEVLGVEDRGRAVVTIFMFMQRPFSPNDTWQRIQICLAGIAGERLCFGNFESGGARDDVAKASEQARALIERGSPGLAHERRTVPLLDAPDFAKVYPGMEITPDENEIMRLSYLRAVERIVDNKDAFQRLWTLMRTRQGQKTLLTEDEMKALLGPRLWATK